MPVAVLSLLAIDKALEFEKSGIPVQLGFFAMGDAARAKTLRIELKPEWM
jgi:hypothetical protein